MNNQIKKSEEKTNEMKDELQELEEEKNNALRNIESRTKKGMIACIFLVLLSIWLIVFCVTYYSNDNKSSNTTNTIVNKANTKANKENKENNSNSSDNSNTSKDSNNSESSNKNKSQTKDNQSKNNSSTKKSSNKDNKKNENKIKDTVSTSPDKQKFDVVTYKRDGYVYANEVVELYSKDDYIHKIIKTTKYDVDKYKSDKDSLNESSTAEDVENDIKKNSYVMKDTAGFSRVYKISKDQKTVTQVMTIDLEKGNLKKLKEGGVVKIDLSEKKVNNKTYISLKETRDFYKDMRYEESK